MSLWHTHLWYYGCCVGNIDFDYGLAAVPANEYTSEPTAKMHADTFGILKVVTTLMQRGSSQILPGVKTQRQ